MHRAKTKLNFFQEPLMKYTYFLIKKKISQIKKQESTNPTLHVTFTFVSYHKMLLIIIKATCKVNIFKWIRILHAQRVHESSCDAQNCQLFITTLGLYGNELFHCQFMIVPSYDMTNESY